MSVPEKDGQTYGEVLNGLIDRSIQSGKPQSHRDKWERELASGPQLPPALAYLWRAFNRLRGRCGGTGFGPRPIGWSDIDAFCRYSGIALVPWEVELIEELDNIFLTEMSRAAKANAPKNGSGDAHI